MNSRTMVPAPRKRFVGLAVAVVTSALALLLLPGCSQDRQDRQDRDEGPVARGAVLRSPIVDEGVKNTYRMSIRTGVVAITTLDRFTSQRDVVVESVTPLRSVDSLEILTVRLSFVYKKGVHGTRGYPGTFCTERWPPVAFVDLHEAPLPVKADDQIAVTVFVRPRGAGDHELTGVRIRYREDGVLKEQTTESTTLTVVARESESALPPGHCQPNVPHHELGEVPLNTPTTAPGAPGSAGGDGHDHTH